MAEWIDNFLVPITEETWRESYAPELAFWYDGFDGVIDPTRNAVSTS